MFAAIDSALQESQSTSTQPSLFFLKALGDSVTVGGPLVPSSNSARERIITDTFRFVTCLHRVCQFLWASCPGGQRDTSPQHGYMNPFSFSAAITCDHSITVLRNSLYPSVDVMGVAQYKAAMLTSSLPAPGMVVCTQAVGHIVKHLPQSLATLMPPQGHLHIQPHATMLRVRGLGCPQVHNVLLPNDVLMSSSSSSSTPTRLAAPTFLFPGEISTGENQDVNSPTTRMESQNSPPVRNNAHEEVDGDKGAFPQMNDDGYQGNSDGGDDIALHPTNNS